MPKEPTIADILADIEHYCFHPRSGYELPNATALRLLAKEVAAQAIMLELLTSETPGKVAACVNHEILDYIYTSMIALRDNKAEPNIFNASRASECIEFSDPDSGVHYEIVIRRIDERSSS